MAAFYTLDLQKIAEEWSDLSHSVKINPVLQSRFFYYVMS